MSDKIPTAEEILAKHSPNYKLGEGRPTTTVKGSQAIAAMIEFAKLHCKEQAKVISEVSLNYETDDKAFDKMGEIIPSLKAEKENKKSILQAYPLKNIK